MKNSSIKLWHGSHRWENPPSLKPPRKNRYEHGPGIYLSTHVSCARKYSKGGGKIILMEVNPSLVLLEDSYLSYDEQMDGLDHISRVKSRKDIERDLKNAQNRHGKESMPAMYLLNLCVNYESLSGQSGIDLANWYKNKGIDASLTAPSTNNIDWLVVFNPNIILSATSKNYNDAWKIGDFKGVKEQLKQIGNPLINKKLKF